MIIVVKDSNVCSALSFFVEIAEILYYKILRDIPILLIVSSHPLKNCVLFVVHGYHD